MNNKNSFTKFERKELRRLADLAYERELAKALGALKEIPGKNSAKVSLSSVTTAEKEDLSEGQWRHKKIILSPDNKEFRDIVLENVSGEDFRVVAEFIEVLK